MLRFDGAEKSAGKPSAMLSLRLTRSSSLRSMQVFGLAGRGRFCGYLCSHVSTIIYLDLSIYVGMHVAVVPSRTSPPAVLLRESFREDGQVRNRTLANLSHWSAAQIDARRMVLKGQSSSALLPERFEGGGNVAFAELFDGGLEHRFFPAHDLIEP